MTPPRNALAVAAHVLARQPDGSIICTTCPGSRFSCRATPPMPAFTSQAPRVAKARR